MVQARFGLSETILNGWRALMLTSDKLEVTVLPDNLAAAMAAGEAIELPGGGRLDTTLTASIIDC